MDCFMGGNSALPWYRAVVTSTAEGKHMTIAIETRASTSAAVETV